MNTEMFIEKVKVVELTFEDGTKKLCRGGEASVERAWGTYPVVSARWTGEEQTMQWIEEEPDMEGIVGWESE
tara:strand:- start:79 stop:294 length:216 start_codon:yes stop_codon:yes gene_type:complete